MTVRLRNISNQLQTVTIVRPNQVIEHAVFSLNYLTLSDEEYPLISPPLVDGVWEIDFGDAVVPIAPPPTTSQYVTDGQNIGTGTPLFKQKVGSLLQFQSLLAGTNISLGTLGDDITISATGGGAGEANTASHSVSGTGTGLIFKTKTGVDLVFKKILAGTNVTVTNGTDDITISATGGGGTPSALAALNIGSVGAVGVATPYAREDHVHKGVYTVKKTGSSDIHGTVTLTAGTNVTLTQTANDITIAATGGAGETNTASNSTSGTGTGLIFKTKTGVDLVFKRILAGTNVTLTNGTDDITINATGGSGQVTQVLTFDSGNIAIRASGSSADLALVTATKDFLTAGESNVLINKPTSVIYHSVHVTFTAAETTGRSTVAIQVPDMAGATSPDKALRPFALRMNVSYGVGGTTSTFAFVSGTTFKTGLAGYSAGAEQKGAFFF